MDDTRRPRSLRLDAEGTEAERIAARMTEITGRRVTLTDYVREALRDANARLGEIVDAPEITTGGSIIDTPDGLVLGSGQTLTGSGVWRIAGTMEVIRIDRDEDDLRDIAAALTDEEDYR